MLVDFFIAGVQKGGTTALNTIMRQHPAVQIPIIKELHFFDNDTLDWQAPDYALLNDNFRWDSQNVVRGEATPIYTYWPNALERLRAYNPAAKLIIALRHPIHRAYSHWRMETSRSAETLGFSEAIRAGRARVRNATNSVHRVFSYVERGFYLDQIARLRNLFPAKQLHFLRTDRLWSEPRATVRAIEVFLGIDCHLRPERRYI